jgi:aspartyl-tRNA(Asn)/glutamyl-tRNA(Gln) amidotransferase subunit C
MTTPRPTTDTSRVDVAYVAHLARLHLTDEEIRTFQGQIGQVVEYVHKLNQLDLSGIEPTSHAAPVHNVFRRDEVQPGLSRDVALANAPEKSEDQFIVPKIVE